MTNSKSKGKSDAPKDAGRLVPTEDTIAVLPEPVERADAERREAEDRMAGEAQEAESTRDSTPRT